LEGAKLAYYLDLPNLLLFFIDEKANKSLEFGPPFGGWNLE
jgi:hypothetical protein